MARLRTDRLSSRRGDLARAHSSPRAIGPLLSREIPLKQQRANGENAGESIKPPRPVGTTEPDGVEAHQCLARLVPAFVRSDVAPVEDCPIPMFDEELEAVAAAVPERRREFLCGRASAHRALSALGVEAAPIAVGTGRQPGWPGGVVGSISHTRVLAGAVVARAADAWGLGLDIELLDTPLDLAVQRLLLTPAEISRMPALEALDPHAARIAFSVKECVYKCLFPRTRWALDFQDVEVHVDLVARRFAAVVAGHLDGPQPPTHVLEGAFDTVDGHVVTVLCL